MSRALPALSLAAAVLLTPSPAHAQIDPGLFQIVQRGVERGIALVPESGDPCVYPEYWFLYGDFTFVNARDRGEFELVPAGKPPDDVKASIERLFAAHPDGRLMTAVSTELRDGCP